MATPPVLFNAASYFVDRHIAEGRGERVAFRWLGQNFTYARVAEGVNRCGNALRALGIKAGDRVLLLMTDRPEFAYGFFGAIKIGAVPVPLNTLLTTDDYAYLFNNSEARALLLDEALVRALGGRARSAVIDHVLIVGRSSSRELPELDHLLGSQSARLEAAPTTKDDPAFWLYTSGTTGKPKAAIHRQRDMLACCQAFGRHVLEIGPDDRCYSVAKLFFAYGLGNALYYPLSVGASSVLYPERFDPVKTFEIIQQERPTLFFAVPTAYAALLQVPDAASRFDVSSLRRCLSAGEPLPPAIYQRWLERFGLEILDGIGSTELCNTFIANRAGAARPGSSGRLVPGYDARIVDDNDRPVPDGEVGDLLMSGESASAGYWNQPALTRKIFNGPWVRTGDRYRRDADGYFWFAGRADDLLKVSGMWVSPTEVEAALLEHEAVVEAAVVGAMDQDQLVKPLAFVVLEDGRSGNSELERDLKDFVKERLAPYKYPRWIQFVAELPKTATGKVQRYKLRRLDG